VKQEGRRVADVISVLPGETTVADQVADVPGVWLIHCHVADHMMEGMFAQFTVHPREGAALPGAFPGRHAPRQSLVWTAAAVTLEPADQFSITLRGRAGIFRGYFPQNQPPSLVHGGRETALAATGADTAAAEGVQWKIEGANAQGVVLENEAEFTLTLTGAAWRTAFAAAAAPGDSEVKLTLRLAGREHETAVPLRTTLEGGTLKTQLRQ
jgi:hypothetical protein